MTPVEAGLRRRIATDGAVTVARFMAEALGAYYHDRDPLGPDGDFVTAPEISQMFGELIGLWAVAAWRQLGAPARFRLVELGPGRGTLMADALRAAGQAPGFIEAAVGLILADAGRPAFRTMAIHRRRHDERDRQVSYGIA